MLALLFQNPFEFIIVAGLLILAISIHEFSHAWAAERLGDCRLEDWAAASEGISGQLNADWVSILMGFPLDWTVVDGSAVSPESSKDRRTE